MKVITNSAEETIAFGNAFASQLKEKDVVILTGPLGAGKTTFTQGILKGFKIASRALSPTFTLMREYHGKSMTVYHADLYRLNAADTITIGLDDYLYAEKSILLIEWGEKIVKSLPAYIVVDFAFINTQGRSIKIKKSGHPHRKLTFN